MTAFSFNQSLKPDDLIGKLWPSPAAQAMKFTRRRPTATCDPLLTFKVCALECPVWTAKRTKRTARNQKTFSLKQFGEEVTRATVIRQGERRR
jgi:hypothetical protein